LLLTLGSAFADVEPNNSIATAEPAALGVLNGSLDLSLGDTEDYYLLTLPNDGAVTLNIAFVGSLNGQLSLFNSSGAVVGTSGILTSGALVVDCIAAGPVYARVFRWSGAASTYTLTVSQVSLTYGADVEPNNVITEVTEFLAVGSPQQGRLGQSNGATFALDGSDHYRVNLPGDGRINLSATNDNTLLTQISVKNRDGVTLATSGISATPTLTLDFLGGDFVYVHINRWSGCGSYQVSMTYNQPLYANDVEPNGTLAQARSLPASAFRQGHLGYSNGAAFPLDGIDYYVTVLPGDGRINLSAESDNGLNLTLTIFNQDGNTLVGSGISATPSTSIDGVAQDTVYFLVNRWNGGGSYRVRYTFDPPDHANDAEPNNTTGTALALAEGVFATGHIGYANGAETPVDNVDFYELDLSGDGKVSAYFETDNGLLLTITLLNQNGVALVGSGINDTLTLVYDGIAQGPVFLSVNIWSGVGSYRVRYTFDPPDHANDAEPNNTTGTALALAAGVFATGHIGYANGAETPVDNVDFYELDLSGDGKVSAYFETDNGLLLTITLLNQNGVALVGSGINDTLTLVYDGIAQGPVFLSVNIWSGVGSYRVKYELLEVPEANDTEPNNVLVDAQLIAPNFPAEGHLGYVNGTPSPIDVKDLYTFSGQAAGPISFDWATSNGLLITLQLLNSAGSTLVGSGIAVSGTLAFNLPDNGTYYLQVSIWSGVGGYTLGVDNGCDLTAIANQQVISVGAQLQWAAVPGATTYNVRRGLAGGPYTVLTTPAKRSVWFPLVEDTDYEWQVQTVCGDRVSGYIPLRPFTTLEFPICPNIGGLLQDSLTATSIKLTWNDSPYAINYRVEYRVVGSPGGSAVNTAAPSAKLIGLLPGTNYEFRVYANCYGDGQSNFRNGTFSTPATREGEQSEAKLWPVPASEYLNVAFTLAQDGSAHLVIVDALGRNVRAFRHAGFAGSNLAELSLVGLSSGIYHLQILDEQGSQQVLPFGIR